MHHFFVTPYQVKETEIFIEGSDVNHIRNVLRIREGEQVSVSDGHNNTYGCRLDRYEEDRAILRIEGRLETDRELPARIYLFQGLPKQEKMEWIVQKAVELGVFSVIPVEMKRSVVKLDDKKAEKKQKRWQQIAESAAKQSGRGCIPQIEKVRTFSEAVRRAEDLDVILLPYELERGIEESRKRIASAAKAGSVGIFIGPEGGFEQWEVEEAEKAGAQRISLGKRILRTETAGLTALSILMFAMEE